MNKIMKLGLFTAVVFSFPLFTMCSNSKPTDNKPTDTMTQIKNTKEIIVDVRTQEEWNYDGHAECSVLIPLDQLQNRISELQGYDKITLVCRSGARAGAAKSLLEANGLKNIVNSGPWQNVQCAVN